MGAETGVSAEGGLCRFPDRISASDSAHGVQRARGARPARRATSVARLGPDCRSSMAPPHVPRLLPPPHPRFTLIWCSPAPQSAPNLAPTRARPCLGTAALTSGPLPAIPLSRRPHSPSLLWRPSPSPRPPLSALHHPMSPPPSTSAPSIPRTPLYSRRRGSTVAGASGMPKRTVIAAKQRDRQRQWRASKGGGGEGRVSRQPERRQRRPRAGRRQAGYVPCWDGGQWQARPRRTGTDTEGSVVASRRTKPPADQWTPQSASPWFSRAAEVGARSGPCPGVATCT